MAILNSRKPTSYVHPIRLAVKVFVTLVNTTTRLYSLGDISIANRFICIPMFKKIAYFNVIDDSLQGNKKIFLYGKVNDVNEYNNCKHLLNRM